MPLSTTGLPTISPAIEQKWAILRTQIEAEMKIIPELRRSLRKLQDLNAFLITWISHNSDVDGITLASRYTSNPQTTGLNAAPTREDPERVIDFTQNEEDENDSG